MSELSKEARELAELLEAKARLNGTDYEVEIEYTFRLPDGTKLVDGSLSSRDPDPEHALNLAFSAIRQAMRVGDG